MTNTQVESKHAIASPSGAEKWMNCPGSLAMEKGIPNKDTSYSKEGTANHELASWALTDGVGQTFVYKDYNATNGISITDDMCEDMQIYVDNILQYADGKDLYVEVPLSIEFLTGEEGAEGTADAVIIDLDELQVHDLKSGYIEVKAERNKQLMVYALAALETFKDVVSPKRVRLVIHQPGRGFLSEWDCSVEELLLFGADVRHSAILALAIYKGENPDSINNYLNPGVKQCQWCRARATCPATINKVSEVMSVDFKDMVESKQQVTQIYDTGADRIAYMLQYVELMNIIARAIKERALSILNAGQDLPGYKLVSGNLGHRRWQDKKIAEETLKSMRLRQEEMYSFEIVNPTQAEKLLAKNNPRKWKKLSQLITRNEGQPTIVAEDHPRPALVVQSVADAFSEMVESKEETFDFC